MEEIAAALTQVFESPSVRDSSGEYNANIVDAIDRHTDAILSLASAIRDLGNGNAATSMGGMEALGKAICDSADTVAAALTALGCSIEVSRA